ncbi:hypothetical protein N1028_13770 [Herbiconiux sp. CPCC 203407]|uniref:Uncharacterized protein n=1 Tax=Herbiconiux oxytropis TaxID=2970915 RepID=A0AA42BVT8_9MICO|nr:hypothetical protein [Herbiconiux oxytropis]MCS5723647.1 hypothetical protein [Herbiconiux oxytropis]MCS5726964.1 hypothetical protein [Herbiconiux oxytropis]
MLSRLGETGVVAIVAVLVLCGCAGVAELAPPDGTTAVSPSASPTPVALPDPLPELPSDAGPGELSGEVVSALLAFRESGPTEFPEHYAGVATGNAASADVLVIYLAGSTPDVDADVLTSVGLPTEKVQLVPAYQSQAKALAVDGKIQEDMSELERMGMTIVSFGPEEDGVEGIDLVGGTDEQVAHLFATYGPYLRIDRDAEEYTF